MKELLPYMCIAWPTKVAIPVQRGGKKPKKEWKHICVMTTISIGSKSMKVSQAAVFHCRSKEEIYGGMFVD